MEPIGPTAGTDVFAVFRHSGGVRAIFESRRGLAGDPEHSRSRMGLAVTGTTGTLSLRFDDRRDAPLRISRSPAPPEDGPGFRTVPVTDARHIPGAAPYDESLRGVHTPLAPMFQEANLYAVWDLMRSIKEGRDPVSNAFTARRTLEMIYGIYASQIRGGRVTFPLKDRQHPLG
ncbi:MAG: hypothetical protein WD708_04040 [Kiritimatiellia bacterium]